VIEVAFQSWNSTKCIWTAAQVWGKVLTFYWQNFDKIPSLTAMFWILLHLPSPCTHIL
jgi:hypothetical protein